ncbi:Transposable element tcb2 transposase [Caligus rogercresseyi]|uniref:Transposable element tcb2 transposase n=1 Tax=Caligus rogercresseyi TaxID=217165 RepID=A0A7T8GYC6_CALRO|nr:Transposable element tcb2 transposase [Caligus rogercresseyi]
MEEEKRHAMFASFRAGRSPKEVIEFFNYPKSTVYDQWKMFTRCCCQAHEVPSSVMVLGKGLKVNTAIYIDVMKNVVKPWMDLVVNGRPYVFQQDSAPAHKSRETQAWLLENLPYHWSPDLWPPSSPDCNPLDYFFWCMVENKTNKHARNTLDSLRAAIVEEFANMKKDVVAKAYGRFRHCLGMVVAADGGYIEK